MMRFSKQALRIYFASQRQQLSQEVKAEKEEQVSIQFQKLSLATSLKMYLSYCAIEEKKELSLVRIEAYLESKYPAARKLIPKINADQLSFSPIFSDSATRWEVNRFGIKEPENGMALKDYAQIDLALLPMLACDKQGLRLGYGKGMYDRFLKQCPSTLLKIGFTCFEPVDAIVDATPMDVGIDMAVTPNAIYYFTKQGLQHE